MYNATMNEHMLCSFSKTIQTENYDAKFCQNHFINTLREQWPLLNGQSSGQFSHRYLQNVAFLKQGRIGDREVWIFCRIWSPSEKVQTAYLKSWHFTCIRTQTTGRKSRLFEPQDSLNSYLFVYRVLSLSYLPNPSARAGYDTRSIFKAEFNRFEFRVFLLLD